MNIWFIVLICLSMMNIGLNLARDGEPRRDKYSFIGSLIGAAINIGITYMAIKQGF